jgi:hypothetical protein
MLAAVNTWMGDPKEIALRSHITTQKRSLIANKSGLDDVPLFYLFYF